MFDLCIFILCVLQHVDSSPAQAVPTSNSQNNLKIFFVYLAEVELKFQQTFQNTLQ